MLGCKRSDRLAEHARIDIGVVAVPRQDAQLNRLCCTLVGRLRSRFFSLFRAGRAVVSAGSVVSAGFAAQAASVNAIARISMTDRILHKIDFFMVSSSYVTGDSIAGGYLHCRVCF